MEALFNGLTTIIVFGLAYAMLLFIISVGLSVTMGLMGFVNLAHGAFAMLGGYLTVTFVVDAGVPFLGALAIAFILVAAISILFERGLYRWLYKRPELDQVMLTIGIVFASVWVVQTIWGTDPMPVPRFMPGNVDLGIKTVPTFRVFMVVAGALIVAGLFFGLERTRFGAQIRAAVDNRRMAQSMGINVDRLFLITFALGSGMAALGGGLGGQILGGMKHTFAFDYLVVFLIVVAVGGLGNIRGTFVAALILGTVDFAGKYLFPDVGSFIIYAITIAILLIKPHGLFGKE